jgi:hypothetical protein
LYVILCLAIHSLHSHKDSLLFYLKLHNYDEMYYILNTIFRQISKWKTNHYFFIVLPNNHLDLLILLKNIINDQQIHHGEIPPPCQIKTVF